ncbi:MAG TPA: carbon-nitrogen family hydrolase [Dermatophilaceae bacterium]|nr:carbon-nitrogen family hydrolase [Dermatophilaceae bacterium]
MRVALIQLGYDDAEPVAERVERAGALVRDQAGADVVVLPELWAPGGFAYPSWLDRAEPVDGPTMSAMAAAARSAGVFLHAGSIVERPASGELGLEGRGLWNTSVLFAADGSPAATYRKIHRFGFGAGEPALMDAGTDLVTVDLPDRGAGVSMRAGVSTCYDLRFPELYRAQLDLGVSAFLLCSCWPAARVAHWSLLGRARAVENQCFVIACNTAGEHAGVRMGGRSQVVAPDGTVLGEAGEAEEVLVVDLDVAQVAAWRAAFPVLADRRLSTPPPAKTHL